MNSCLINGVIVVIVTLIDVSAMLYLIYKVLFREGLIARIVVIFVIAFLLMVIIRIGLGYQEKYCQVSNPTAIEHKYAR